jgi:hypothetical protein
MGADRKGIITAFPQRGFVRSKTTYIFWKNWITASVAGQRHNNAFSLGSVFGQAVAM